MKFRVCKLKKNPKWLVGGHFGSANIENQDLPIATNNIYMKFEIEIPKQTRVILQKPCHLILKPEDPICLPGGHFESGIKFIGFYPYTQVMCYCILDLIFKAKLKLESWNQIIQSWKWRCWKSIGFYLWLQSTCIWNLKLKFQSKLDLRSGNHVTYRWMDRWTRWFQYTPLQLRWAYNEITCQMSNLRRTWQSTQLIRLPQSSKWLNLTAFLGIVDSEVHKVHISRVIIALYIGIIIRCKPIL